MKEERTGEQLRAMVEALPFAADFKGIPSPSLPQEELESEYINSFDIGFGPSIPCPLYESAYREDTSSRDITEELLRFYEHFDVQLSDKEKDYPDHLVVELEFMAFLAKKEADGAQRGNDPSPYRLAQMDFLERHLEKWVCKLDERIQRGVKEPFYQAASSFLRELMSTHLSHLREVDAVKSASKTS
jgi:DMSO reductase family type II enzyme chaperone